jgi:hypothetical protein
MIRTAAASAATFGFEIANPLFSAALSPFSDEQKHDLEGDEHDSGNYQERDGSRY